MKNVLIALLLFVASIDAFSQSSDSEWTLGVSGSFVSFSDDGRDRIKDKYNYQFPKINLTKYILKGFSADAGITIGAIDKIDGFFENSFNYVSFDALLRYDFNLSKENLVPYIGVGASWIGAPSTIPSSKSSPTLNFAFGGTFWFHHQWGLQAQYMYKHSDETIESMVSHTQFSAGIVYSFAPRQMVYRLWER